MVGVISDLVVEDAAMTDEVPAHRTTDRRVLRKVAWFSCIWGIIIGLAVGYAIWSH